ncbi:uncharacterized protein [Oryza sativa Japonica Group]|uniref:Os04g0103800 protein n=2 Tax=Oryza sativa subsp. japonica TaxID=39947 RepID=Q0JFH1_ORYSJ|nr:WASH complex subunit 3 [Oryza sativa Japonica Group]BAF13916.1 Os04g0103800 [Oryza sativa Japonica Group]BAG99001.1 unnamed protein product [Oryza sativa Japonica Group]BAS87521.1 Os04g0103800 [Oryza sativa Japonica Group]|eukprot:NP_001052002.1 Os04g0103800 [Oryza sativa Japonica Group]
MTTTATPPTAPSAPDPRAAGSLLSHVQAVGSLHDDVRALPHPSVAGHDERRRRLQIRALPAPSSPTSAPLAPFTTTSARRRIPPLPATTSDDDGSRSVRRRLPSSPPLPAASSPRPLRRRADNDDDGDDDDDDGADDDGWRGALAGGAPWFFLFSWDDFRWRATGALAKMV